MEINILSILPEENFKEFKTENIKIFSYTNTANKFYNHSDISDYITIFLIYFSTEITKEIAKTSGKHLLKKISMITSNIWNTNSKKEYSKIKSNGEIEKKKPNAKLFFKLDEDTNSYIEIQGEVDSEFLEELILDHLNKLK